MDYIPSDAVNITLVHMHPYGRGTSISCGSRPTRLYRNRPSEEDVNVLKKLNIPKGIVVDADEIIPFDKNYDPKYPPRNTEERCGY